ncbi:hypothetical protein STXM2123_3864 [Streptomyces sp. F-3]|nr:hypothetical protein STXM2123_3864 [Streptomyces sp. F-3]
MPDPVPVRTDDGPCPRRPADTVARSTAGKSGRIEEGRRRGTVHEGADAGTRGGCRALWVRHGGPLEGFVARQERAVRLGHDHATGCGPGRRDARCHA